MKIPFGRTPVFLLILLLFNSLKAQDSLKTNLRSKAQKNFTESNFTKALPLYRELLHAFPKEPEYQYGVGVCLTFLNQEPEEAINLLRSASLSSYTPSSWYYLGVVLHRNYDFDEALRAYSKFLLAGKRADIKSLEVERQIEMVRNGAELTRSGHDLVIISARSISTDQLQAASEINGSGKLMKKPLEFCSRQDIRADYRPWMFLPVHTAINEFIYLAGYEKKGRNGKQLFRIRNLNDETWGIPELLDAPINTVFDEEYPFFDPKSSTLYFSSKGYNSMGGYDIFRSVYDWNTKTWSVPENLGFPINSPYDDFLYITDEYGRYASFISNRNSPGGYSTVYRLKLEKDRSNISYSSLQEIRQASRLEVIPLKQGYAAGAKEVQDRENNPQMGIAILDRADDAPAKSDYGKVLANALQLQLKADSFGRIARDLRIQAKVTPDDEQKKALVSAIIDADRETKRFQREADQKFEEARKLESRQVEAPPDTSVKTLSEDHYPNLTEKADEFALLQKSPYDDRNPIPEGRGIQPGLCYRIQLGVFSKPRTHDFFGGISPVCYEYVSGGNLLKYYAGLFYSLNSVNGALARVRATGFPDAFVVAFIDGKMISTEQAREIEFAGFKL